MIIEIKSPRLNYKLDIGDINPVIIQGDSASGKSMLLQLLENFRKVPTIMVKSEIPLLHLTAEFLEIVHTLTKDRIYILDNEDGIEEPKIVEAINSGKVRFILITRDASIPLLKYDENNIFEFKTIGRQNILVKKNNLNKGQTSLNWS